MFFVVILVIMLGIVGTAVIVGLSEEKKKGSARRLTAREKVQLAKSAGVFPPRGGE